MAFSFPLTRAAFLNLLPVQDVRFYLGQQHQIAGLGGGEILKAETGPALWRGSVDLAPMKSRTAAEFEALIAVLEAPGASFEACKPNQTGPAGDPGGALLGASTPEIMEISGDGSRLKLQDLPNGYTFAPGDFLSFTYNTDRTALHRCASGGTSALGSTGFIDVVPFVRVTFPAAAVAVEIIRPYCRAVLVPGSVDYGTTRNGITSGVSFQFQQTLR